LYTAGNLINDLDSLTVLCMQFVAPQCRTRETDAELAALKAAHNASVAGPPPRALGRTHVAPVPGSKVIGGTAAKDSDVASKDQARQQASKVCAQLGRAMLPIVAQQCLMGAVRVFDGRVQKSMLACLFVRLCVYAQGGAAGKAATKATAAAAGAARGAAGGGGGAADTRRVLASAAGLSEIERLKQAESEKAEGNAAFRCVCVCVWGALACTSVCV
jgi:hypothetical protein